MAESQNNMHEHDRRLEKAIEKALRLVGGLAERKAKETISDMEAVDTGFLRNSITFALAGEAPNIGTYQDDDGNKEGTYEGQAPADDDKSQHTVYIGTNVYYAPYVEYGARGVPARPFLATAIQAHKEEYEKLFKEAFEHYMK